MRHPRTGSGRPREINERKDVPKSTLVLTTIGIIIVTTLSMFSGLVMFAHYFGCDPLKLNLVETYDQLVPMYVMEICSFIPGLPGLFISGIFSASLSALSMYLNCTATILYQDFLSSFVPKGTSQERISLYLKLLVVMLGIIATALVYVVEQLGSLFALTLSVSAISGAPLFGLFTAGMLIPMVHSKGAICAGITSLLVTGWMIMGSQWYKIRGAITYATLPVSIDKCNETITGAMNYTLRNVMTLTTETPEVDSEPPFILYRISFYYYTMMGAFITITMSILVSYFTKRDKPLNRDCISPIAQFLIKEQGPLNYTTVEKARDLLNKE